MRSFKLIILLISALTLSISGCKKDKPNPPTGGGGGGGGATADCCICDVDGMDYTICEDDYTAAEWEEVMDDFDCDCSPNSAGYVCESGCETVSSGADYSSFNECAEVCDGSEETGWICFNGECISVQGFGVSQSECENSCGGGSSDCCMCDIGGTEVEVCEDNYSAEDWALYMDLYDCDC